MMNRRPGYLLNVMGLLLFAALACNLPSGAAVSEEKEAHGLIPVKVESEAQLSGIDVKDWSAPPNSFPRRPDA